MARRSRYPENNKLVSFSEHLVRVGIYARLSEADGDDVISDSILNQIAIALVEVMVEKIVIHCEQKFIIEYNFHDLGLQP